MAETPSLQSIKESYLKENNFGFKEETSYNIPESYTTSAKYISRKVKDIIAKKTGNSSSDLDENSILELIKKVEENEGEELTENERNAALASIASCLDHYDILTPLIEDKEINDIIVKSYNDISIQKNRKNFQTDLSFQNQEIYKSFFENLLKRADKTCTTSTPVVDACIDKNIRICACHESFSPPNTGPMLTIRVARQEETSAKELTKFGLAPNILMQYLSLAMKSKQASILIAGEVGSGKTTLLKALLGEVDETESILVIEDTHEIAIQRKFIRTLVTRESNSEGVGKITPAKAIRTGMRMAMNRLVLGEMRDAEAAESFIDVCSSGHSGISTIHARSAKDAISRLELFLARAQGNVDSETIKRQIANAISLVIYLDTDQKQTRRIIEVIEVGNYSDGNIQISPIFSFESKYEKPRWRKEGGISIFEALLRKNNLILPDVGNYLSLEQKENYITYKDDQKDIS